MTAPLEITTSKMAAVNGPVKERVMDETLPSLLWPMNIAVLKNRHTRIVPSSSTEGPRLTIHTAADSAFAVRSPITGQMQSIHKPDNTSTVIITPPNSSSFVVLGNLQSVTRPKHDLVENAEVDPSAASEVKAGEIIGDYGSIKEGFILQLAHLTRDPATPNQSWELIDPLQKLPTLQ